MKKYLSLFFILTNFSFVAQNSASKAALADSLFKKKDWAACAKAYAEIVKTDKNTGRNYFRLGSCYHNLKQYDKAIDPYKKCISIAQNNFAMYQLACVYAATGQKDSALVWLDQAISSGFMQQSRMESDEELTSIRSHERFKELTLRLDQQAHPCKYDYRYRDFDFWLGEWNVYDLNGNLAGESRIEQILGDCVILENWSGKAQGMGKSFNTFNTAEGKWRQTWVDALGSFTEFKNGEFKDGKMQFLTDMNPSSLLIQRLTFYKLDNGNVRQHGESSLDEGKTWTTSYDLLYKKK